MEPFWEPNGHGAPHTVKYESDTTVSGFAYCNDGGLNFAASTAAYSEDDGDFGSGRRGKASRQDPLSHRIIEKRRRDRMNSCLADLSRLIPPQYQRKGRGRIEKTEIIEMSIRYMKQLQHQEYLHRENMYKLGYEECLQQAANYLYTGHHREICYQMVDHLKELMKGECLKIRNNNHSTLDSVSASSGSPPSSHHHLNGAFHPVAPLSQLRDMLTASDTEHSSDHHDLHDQHDDHEHDHHLGHLGHEDDGGGHHHLHHHHDEDDVKDLSLRRTAAAAAAAAVAAANGVGNKSLATNNAMVGPRSVGPSLAASSQQAPVITSSSIINAAAAAAAASAATGSCAGHQQQQQHQQQQRQPPLHSVDSVSNTDFDSSASRSSSVHLLHHPHSHLHNHHHPHHHDNSSSQSPPPPPSSSSSLQPPMRSPPSPRHHDHDGDHHHHHDDDHHHHHHHHHAEPDQPDQALRAVRLRKLSHDTTATCAHDIIDHQHSYKFKNYIQQRFSQDSHNHHHDASRTPSPIDSIDNGLYKKMKLGLDYDQSISCDEKPPVSSVNRVIGSVGTAATAAAGVTDDCKPEVSAFPMFKSMQPASVVVPIPTAGVGGGQLPSAGGSQMVPIFALHSHGRFYVPLSVEYAALVPYLNGVDLLDKQSAPLSPPLPPPGPLNAMVSGAPPLHSININVNFAGSTMAAAANAAAAAASVLVRPKIVVGGTGGGTTSMPPTGPSVMNANGAW